MLKDKKLEEYAREIVRCEEVIGSNGEDADKAKAKIGMITQVLLKRGLEEAMAVMVRVEEIIAETFDK